jgi:redox-sensitive bicupin YhaK (pirin superfamily)
VRSFREGTGEVYAPRVGGGPGYPCPMEPVDLKDLVAFEDDGPTHRTVAETERLWSELVCLQGPQSVGPIGDEDSDALCVVVAGRVVAQVDRSRTRLSQWQTLAVPAGSSLTLTNASEEPSVVLLVAAPPPVGRAVEG